MSDQCYKTYIGLVKKRFEVKNQLSRLKELSYIVILGISVLLSVSFVTPSFAIIPVLTDVDVWNSGGDTILNVTVFHSPEDPSHHVDLIQVDIEGNIQNFTVVVQPTTTFTIPCNLGPIEGTPSARVRVRCTVDGYNSWSEPFEVPEFSLPVLLLTLVLVTSLAVFVLRKTKSNICK